MVLLTPLAANADTAASPRTATAAAKTTPAEPAQDPGDDTPQEFQTLPEPAPAPERSNCDEQHLKELRDAGQKRAVCVEWGAPQEAAKKQTARPKSAAKSAGSAFWCANENMNKTYVTRTSICSRRSMTILLVDTITGKTWGKARGYTEQEIDTQTNSVEFDEHFKFHLTDSDITSSVMTVKAEAICSLDDSCKQRGPWADKPQPITVGQSVEGHWSRSWNGTKGRKTFLLQYDIIVNIGSGFGNLSWGGHLEPGGGTFKVRCDNSVNRFAGCVVPSFTPTLVVPKKHKEARAFIAVAQASMSTHPGLKGAGKPLHREGSLKESEKNRAVICDSTYKAASNTPNPTCDEFPFAKSKESGRRLGVKSGKECQWYWVAEDTVNGKKNSLLMWDGLFEAKLPPSAKCARASMPSIQNKGVGGALGNLTKEERLLNNDPYWVDAGAKK
ncbi:hypothetical protein ABT390_34110 [Streptomyces aurantiacus]|uniref:hypothetical protein n=1 Tax=Streptomyces aurantiacus TaxID=47760 RepID=UPI00131A179C|nr:hypothetical protein [Streptomyces aurantiacus]